MTNGDDGAECGPGHGVDKIPPQGFEIGNVQARQRVTLTVGSGVGVESEEAHHMETLAARFRHRGWIEGVERHVGAGIFGYCLYVLQTPEKQK